MSISDEDYSLFVSIASQLCQNVFQESGNDYSDHIDRMKGMFRIEDGKLLRIGFGGMKFETISSRLFDDIDVSHVKEVSFDTARTRILEAGTFDRFERLEIVTFHFKAIFEEASITDEEWERINFIDFRQMSDYEYATKIEEQFVANYKKEFGKVPEYNFPMREDIPRDYGYGIKRGKLTEIYKLVSIPKLSARLFDGIDVSDVTVLDLNGCEIEEIEDGALDLFTSLFILSLKDNKLETLPRISDEVLSNLGTIDINRNPKLVENIRDAIRAMSPNFIIFFEGQNTGQFNLVSSYKKEWINRRNLHEYIKV